MKFSEQTTIYLDRLAKRKRNPVKPGTLAVYRSHLNNWILPQFGALPLAKVDNGAMRDLVAHLTESGLKPATVASVQNIVKEVISSCIDKQGNELYPRTWNAEFIDAPVVEPSEQKTPLISQLQAITAISKAPSLYGSLFLLAAGSGLRISELLALKARPEPNRSYFDPERKVIVVQTALYRGVEQAPKSKAGIREVDLYVPLSDHLIKVCPSNGYLFTGYNSPLDRSTAYEVADNVGVPGFHSFRRFRATHLESNSVPDSLMKFWMGHAGVDITDRYIKIGSEIETRKEWATKVGIGVSIP